MNLTISDSYVPKNYPDFNCIFIAFLLSTSPFKFQETETHHFMSLLNNCSSTNTSLMVDSREFTAIITL